MLTRIDQFSAGDNEKVQPLELALHSHFRMLSPYSVRGKSQALQPVVEQLHLQEAIELNIQLVHLGTRFTL